ATGRLRKSWSGPACLAAVPAFSPDGKNLACGFTSAAGASQLVVRDVTTGRVVFRKSAASRLIGPRYTREGKIVTVASDSTIRVHDGRSGAEVRSWRGSGLMQTAL